MTGSAAGSKPIWYAALSAPQDRTRGTRLDANVYRDPGSMTFGRLEYQAPTEGRLPRGGREGLGGAHSMETGWSDAFEIAMGLSQRCRLPGEAHAGLLSRSQALSPC